MKNIIIGIFLFIITISIIVGGTWTYKWFTAPIRGKIEKREKIQGRDFRIYSYDHFYDLYSSYQSYKDALRAQLNVLESAEDSSEKRRIRQNIAGIKSQMARVREEYNNDSRKQETVGKFKSWDLPEKLSIYNVE